MSGDNSEAKPAISCSTPGSSGCFTLRVSAPPVRIEFDDLLEAIDLALVGDAVAVWAVRFKETSAPSEGSNRRLQTSQIGGFKQGRPGAART